MKGKRILGYFLSGILLAAIVCLSIVLFVRRSRADAPSPLAEKSWIKDRNELQDSRNIEYEERYELRDIQDIEMIGDWTCIVTQGERAEGFIRSPRPSYWSVGFRGSSLILRNTEKGNRRNEYTAIITMPMLESILNEGDSSFTLFDADLDHLEIINNGDLVMEAENSRINEFSLRNSGDIDLDFQKIPLDQASLSMAGTGIIELLMEGRALNVEGSGREKVYWSGTVSRQNMDDSFRGRMEHRD